MGKRSGREKAERADEAGGDTPQKKAAAQRAKKSKKAQSDEPDREMADPDQRDPSRAGQAQPACEEIGGIFDALLTAAHDDSFAWIEERKVALADEWSDQACAVRSLVAPEA